MCFYFSNSKGDLEHSWQGNNGDRIMLMVKFISDSSPCVSFLYSLGLSVLLDL